ncbi:enhancer of rudimentary homolog [Selaginella moellendorffii]|uniref:enhancer of rudimentary homolog n=1 Tax=Selaginella moellendorffii TaxID=88036 RepID=UPI000D1C884C|nr:enhancer of rudimentary homolog [Selaginella moellendorffii]|eukprot:XP_024528033.1 enhancer of rudimentary homolog [Selaginella moellendorffii]
MGSSRHTIVLFQPYPNRSSRTYMEFDSVYQSMDGICGLFEKRLKDSNPTVRNLTYDVSELYEFIDALPDLSALIFDTDLQAYVPYDRSWIKLRVYQHLKKYASQGPRSG